LDFIKESIGDGLHGVRFTSGLHKHAACLSSEGALSANMEKVLNKTPGAEGASIKAELVLEINREHPLADRLRSLYESDKETLKKYSRVLYAQARLVSGLSIENPAEISDLVCGMML
jgi:molecular chaperone HtpG